MKFNAIIEWPAAAGTILIVLFVAYHLLTFWLGVSAGHLLFDFLQRFGCGNNAAISEQQALAAAISEFAHEHPNLSLNNPATALTGMIHLASRYPELVGYMDRQLSEEGYLKPSQLLQAYQSGMPLQEVLQLGLTPLEEQRHRTTVE